MPSDTFWSNACEHARARPKQALLDAGGMAGDNGGQAVADAGGISLHFGVKACRSRDTLLDFAKALKRIGQEAERRGLRAHIR